MDAQVAGKTLFLGVSVRMSPKEISIWLSRLGKDLPSPLWVGIIQSTEGPNRIKKGKQGQNLGFLFLSLNAYLLLPPDIKAPGSWAFTLQDLQQCPLLPFHPTHSPLRFAGLWTQTELFHQLSSFSSLQRTDCGTSQPPKLCEPIHIINIFSLSIYLAIHLSIHPSYWFCFSGEP